MNHAIILVCCLFLAGCVGGPPKDFYRAYGNSGGKIDAPHKEPVWLHPCSNSGAEVDWFRERNYHVIGTAEYRGEIPKNIELTKQAQRVGATLVVWSFRYGDTVSGIQHYSVRNPSQTIESDTSGSVIGSRGGWVGYSEHTTTTVPGGYSHYSTPYSFDRHDIHIVFLAK